MIFLLVMEFKGKFWKKKITYAHAKKLKNSKLKEIVNIK